MKYFLFIILTACSTLAYAQSNDNKSQQTDKNARYNSKGDQLYPEITFSKESKKSIKAVEKKEVHTMNLIKK